MNEGSRHFLAGTHWTWRQHLRVTFAPPFGGPASTCAFLAPRRRRAAAPPFRPARLDPSQIVAETRVLGEALRERAHDRERHLQMAARLLGLPLRAGRYRQSCQADEEAAPLLGMARIVRRH